MLILAVDDDVEDCELFCDAIQEIDSSIIIVKARNGEEALNALTENILLPDFIFLDINMPLMDGKACLNQIRKDKKYKDIPVVMYSTSKNEDEIRQYKALGANFLVKPEKFGKLVKSLAFVLGYSSERVQGYYA
jgi:CheY-like chemotaxis protein